MNCIVKSVINGAPRSGTYCPEYQAYLERAFSEHERVLARDLGTNARQTGAAQCLLGNSVRRDHQIHRDGHYCGVSNFESPGSERSTIIIDCRDHSGQAICYHKATATEAGIEVEEELFETSGGTIRTFGTVCAEFIKEYRPRPANFDFGTCRQDYREDGLHLVCDFIQSLEGSEGMQTATTRSFTEGMKRRFFNEYPAEVTQAIYGNESVPPVVQLMTNDYISQGSFANLMDPMYIVWYAILSQANQALTTELLIIAFHHCKQMSVGHVMSVTSSFIRAVARHSPGMLNRMANDYGMFVGPEFIHDEQMLVPYVMTSGNTDILAECVTYLSAWNNICGEKRIQIKSQNGTTDQRFNLNAYIQGNYLGSERTRVTIPVHFNHKQLNLLLDRPLTPKDCCVIRDSLARLTGTDVVTFRSSTMTRDLQVFIATLAKVWVGLKGNRSKETQELVGTCVKEIQFLIKNGRHSAEALESDVHQLIRFVSIVFDAGFNLEETVVFSVAAQIKVFASSAILQASETMKRCSPYMMSYQRSAKILSLLKDGRTLPNVFSSRAALEAVLEPLCGLQVAHVLHSVPSGESSPSLNSAIRFRSQPVIGVKKRRMVDIKSTKASPISLRSQTKYHRVLASSMT